MFSYNLILSLYSYSLSQMQIWSFYSNLRHFNNSQCPQNKIKPPHNGKPSTLASSLALSPSHPTSQPSNCMWCADCHTVSYLRLFIYVVASGWNTLPSITPQIHWEKLLRLYQGLAQVSPFPWRLSSFSHGVCEMSFPATSRQVEVTFPFCPLQLGQVFFTIPTTFYYIALCSCLSFFLDSGLLKGRAWV